jgi:predicted ferric reductase
MLFAHLLWLSLGVVAAAILVIRTGEILWAKLRQVSAMSAAREKQMYWRTAQWSWMPFLKRAVVYSPLWSKRHNREIRLSTAVNVGTLPSRLQLVLITLYMASNAAYLFILDWSEKNRYAVCAELRGRSGTIALVNMVPLVILAGRNNPLIGLLKISFDTYNLLHRWLGRLVVAEIIIHTVAWAVPALAAGGWKSVHHDILHSNFIASGTAGLICLLIIFVVAYSPIRHAFYETFLNTHIILAFIVLVCTWIHCASASVPGGLPQLPWIIAVMGLWLGERLARAARLVYVNWSDNGFTHAICEALPGEVTRVTIRLPRYLDVQPGTHAYLRFKDANPWESHPFSVAWVNHRINRALPLTELSEKHPFHPLNQRDYSTEVSFVIGARTGMTRKLYQAAGLDEQKVLRTTAAMEGPYAGHHSLDSYGHAVLFAGSTGITHQVSYLRHLLEGYNAGTVATRRLTLVWVIREYESLEWVRPFMDAILRIPNRKDVLRVQVFVTRPRDPRDLVSSSATIRLFPGRPNVPLVLAKEVEEQVGAMCVTVCGPGAFGDDVRAAVRGLRGGTVVDFVEESFTW